MTTSKLGTDIQTGQIIDLPKSSRLQGLYIIGIQGTGKSGLIENLILQDIRQQIGVCVLDPHGELIEHVIARLPDKQTEDKVILLDIENEDYPFGLNLFMCSNPNSPKEVEKTVDRVRHIFDKLLGVTTETPLILEYLLNCTHTLIANPGYTMADILLLLSDKNCRQQLVANVADFDVRLFWQQYEQMKPSEQIEQISSLRRRVREFLQPLTRPIVGQSTTTIDLQDIMNKGHILLVKLSAKIESVSSLIGSVLVALLLNAAYNRPAQRRQFHLYADEFQRFATEDFATLLEEARKFGIATTIAHQNRGQLNSANSKLETDLKDRSRSVGNMVVFKINSKDADDLAGEFKIAPPATETRREANLTYKQDVLGHLRQQGHKNARVNEFANKYLPKLFYAAQQQIDKSPMGLRITKLDYVRYPHISYQEGDFYAFDPDEVRKQLIAFNIYLYNLMRDDWTTKKITPSILDNTNEVLWAHLEPNEMVKALSAVLGFPHYYLGQCEPRTPEGIQAFKRLMEIKQTKDALMKQLVQCTTDEERKKVRQALDANSNLNRIDEYKRLQHALYKESGLLIAEDLIYQKKHPLEIGTRIELYQNRLVAYRYEGGSSGDLNDLANEIFGREKWRFDDFVFALDFLTYDLSREPIMVESGSYEEKPLTPRTYADVQNEIANSLVGIPNFTARVKIASTNGTVEHTIKTLEPEKGIYGKLLQERIDRIRTRNIQQGCLLERTRVEAEITKRQSSCSGGSAPVQQPQQPSPQQAQARHARQVPVQGYCPNCGKANPPGAQFCNQCGTKL